jgi:uncharacterized protein YqeY
MKLSEKIISDLTMAMKSRDAARSQVLRSIKAALQEKEISMRSSGERVDLADEVVTQVLMKAAKQRKDSIQQFEQANRADLASVEKQELEIIESYLPKMMSEVEIFAIVKETAAAVGATSPADMGKLMGALMPKVKGKADGSIVNRLVKEHLAG